MVLALFRYFLVCLDTSTRLHCAVKAKVTPRMVLLIFLAVTTPAILWAVVMFYSRKASGLPYHAKFSQEEGTVILFQDLEDEQRGLHVTGIIMGCLMLFYGLFFVFIS